jgi:hypothetical protein
MKTVLSRSLAIALYLGLGAIAFLTGRRHQIYFNNYAAGSAQAAGGIAQAATVTLEGMKPLRVRANGMRVAEIGPGEYVFRVEYEDGRPPFTGKFRVPVLIDAVVIPVAGLREGSDLILIPAQGSLGER